MPVRVEFPDKMFVEFENVERALRVPFVVYADFESILEPIQHCQPDPNQPYTTPYQRHNPMSYCCYLKCTEEVANLDPTLPTTPYIYRGKDAAKHFMQYLKELAQKVTDIYRINREMLPLTYDEKQAFNEATMCYMCDKPLDGSKVRDHCHITGKYRGAAHNKCNLRYKVPNFLPVFLHNMSGYDSHFIVKELAYDKKQIDVIPSTEEKYISFAKTINKDMKIKFLDTFRFMPSSLDNLARNLPHYKEMKKFFDEDQIQLLTRKGIFPYEYVTSWEILDETSLPPKSEFYSTLSGSEITEDDYKHAKNVWNSFNCQTLGDYSDHYLKTDVLLLADIFENFRDVTLKTHKLDPAHYFTLPGLSWDAMLRFTGIRLELLKDYEMLLMIENGIRGGICQVSHRYAQANNKYMESYNPDEPTTFISYQDCNNLYGYAMSKPLPYGGFEWVSPESIDLNTLTPDNQFGYILDVNIEYPQNLHRLHNDLPFLPENIKIGNQKKLVPHFNYRENYIVHYTLLQQALKHGLHLKKINRVIRFKQSSWLQKYINHNTALRKAATNDFEKDLYKLYNNSVYGKTMENIRNRKEIKLVCDEKKIEKLIAKPDFIDRTIYSENLAAIHMAKKKLVFNKPIYVGMCILDISKYRMYEYHYQVMLPRYGPENIKLLYMDTDSFIYWIKTQDIYEDMITMLEHMDTSDYPKDHPCFSLINKKVLGKFKDEANGVIILGYVGLRSKLYSIKLQNREIKKAKGVKKNVLQKNITYDDYVECVLNNLSIRLPMTVIQSKKHNVSTVEINKLSLSPSDDKRQILEDGISTRALGFKE